MKDLIDELRKNRAKMDVLSKQIDTALNMLLWLCIAMIIVVVVSLSLIYHLNV